MKKEEFLKKMIEAIEIEDEIDEKTILTDIVEWDSLAAVTTLALFKKHLGLKIPAIQVKQAKTIGDILNLAGGELI